MSANRALSNNLIVERDSYGFAEFVSVLTKLGSVPAARRMFKDHFPKSPAREHFEPVLRAMVDPLNIDTDSGIAPEKPLADAFMAYSRPRSALLSLPDLHDVPMRTRIPRQTAGTTAAWVGEQETVAFSAGAFDTVTIEPTKCVGMIALTKELAQLADPRSIAALRDEMADAVAAFADSQFFDPSISSTGHRPASITFGQPTVTASGTSADAFRADARNLVEQMRNAGNVFRSPAWVMSPGLKLSMGLLDGGLMRDGKLADYPVLTSGAAILDGDSPDDQMLVLVDGDAVAVADDGAQFDSTDQGNVLMDDAPDSPQTASSVLVSLWQRNFVALKVVRYLNWVARREGTAGVIRSARYGS